MPQLQIEINQIGSSYSSSIAKLEVTLDAYTLEVHSNINMAIHRGLQMFNCECKQIGSKNYKLFQFFYNLKCQNCTRRRQRDKYREYTYSYDYVIKRVQDPYYSKQIQLYTGIKVTMPIDRDRLLNLLILERVYVRTLWSRIDQELRVDHDHFNPKRTEITEPKSNNKPKQKEKLISKPKQYRARNITTLDSLFKGRDRQHENQHPNGTRADLIKQPQKSQEISLQKKQASGKSVDQIYKKSEFQIE